jgi:hypothetical protein
MAYIKIYSIEEITERMELISVNRELMMNGRYKEIPKSVKKILCEKKEYNYGKEYRDIEYIKYYDNKKIKYYIERGNIRKEEYKEVIKEMIEDEIINRKEIIEIIIEKLEMNEINNYRPHISEDNEILILLLNNNIEMSIIEKMIKKSYYEIINRIDENNNSILDMIIERTEDERLSYIRDIFDDRILNNRKDLLYRLCKYEKEIFAVNIIDRLNKENINYIDERNNSILDIICINNLDTLGLRILSKMDRRIINKIDERGDSILDVIVDQKLGYMLLQIMPYMERKIINRRRYGMDGKQNILYEIRQSNRLKMMITGIERYFE